MNEQERKILIEHLRRAGRKGGSAKSAKKRAASQQSIKKANAVRLGRKPQ